MIFLPSKKFEKHLKKLGKAIKLEFDERIKMFVSDKFHPLLNNHKLHPPYSDCRSIDITGDIRTVFKEIDKDTILLIDIGPHSALYE